MFIGYLLNSNSFYYLSSHCSTRIEPHLGSHSAGDDQLRCEGKVQPGVSELTDTVNHTFCQDTRSLITDVLAHRETHTHTQRYKGIKGGMEFFKGGLLSGSDKGVERLRVRGGSDKSKR